MADWHEKGKEPRNAIKIYYLSDVAGVATCTFMISSQLAMQVHRASSTPAGPLSV
jgi:hypothetical protein